MTATTKPTSKIRAWYAGLGEAWERMRRAIFVWEKTGNRSAEKALLVVVLLLVVAFGLGRWTAPAPVADHVAQPSNMVAPPADLQPQIDTLRLRVAVLEAQQAGNPAPDPVPARPGAPRAALRPTPPAAPESAPSAWGATDLDRAIAAFPSITHLEQAK